MYFFYRVVLAEKKILVKVLQNIRAFTFKYPGEMHFRQRDSHAKDLMHKYIRFIQGIVVGGKAREKIRNQSV